jgi:hypothetical protein
MMERGTGKGLRGRAAGMREEGPGGEERERCNYWYARLSDLESKRGLCWEQQD